MAILKKGSTVDGKNIVTEDQIEGVAQIVATPQPVYPLTGEENVPITTILTAGNYLTSYPGLARTGRQFQICQCQDSSFTNLLFDQTVNSNSVSVSPSLAMENGYSWRCRDIAGAYKSKWSAVQRFTTGTTYLLTPTVTVQGAPTAVAETPVLTGSAFVVSGGTDTHASTDWEVRKVSGNSLVWSKNGATGAERTSIVVPAGYLVVGTDYTFRARYRGAVYTSQWGSATGKTQTVFFQFTPAFVGRSYGGGYYAGNIKVGQQTYALVVAPATQGGQSSNSSITWSVATATPGTSSLNDGLANTNAIIASGATAPAAQFCANLNINGYQDWYLPSRDELEICYRAFKPTTNQNSTSYGVNTSAVPPTTNYTLSNPAQTSVEIFRFGGSEAFRGLNWTSTAGYGDADSFSGNGLYMGVYGFNFTTGSVSGLSPWSTCGVRAIRRVAI